MIRKQYCLRTSDYLTAWTKNKQMLYIGRKKDWELQASHESDLLLCRGLKVSSYA